MHSIDFSLRLPDPWQRDAVERLRSGCDVVLSAPTGAGKTYVFELLVQGGWKGQCVYTVPTRALANDKLLEWRRRGWNVGIVTGDVTDKPDAPVVVATLETQRGRFLRGDGPTLLVVDEYQLIADPVRGANYELAIALAPAHTRLLLLSGSVANPHDVVDWLRRIGRPAELVHTVRRPVPLEEVFVEALASRVPDSVRGFWPRIVAKALGADLGPLLLFAPQRKTAEALARQIAGAVPCQQPLFLDAQQEKLAGPDLARLLARRVSYHHSGLTYAQRAQLVEPLAKAGKLRVVVATTGLAAGINFSLRSVCVTESEYLTDNTARRIEPDALLQMFGRAGRRGLDDTGSVLAVPERPRLIEARPRHLRRAPRLDWPSLLAVMGAAVDAGGCPFTAARRFTERLFAGEPPPLGFERSQAFTPAPCGVAVDHERARLAASTPQEHLGPDGWVPSAPPASVPLGRCLVRQDGRWVPALSQSQVLARFPLGSPARIDRVDTDTGMPAAIAGAGRAPRRRFGRRVIAATCDARGVWHLAPSLAKAFREAPKDTPPAASEAKPLMARLLAGDRAAQPARRPVERPPRQADALQPWLEQRLDRWTMGGRIVHWERTERDLAATLDFAEVNVPAVLQVGAADDALACLDPEVRRERPEPCRTCPSFDACLRSDAPGGAPAAAWLRLGLIDAAGKPTPRGRLFSHFIHGEGLALAAALEATDYEPEDAAYDLASLRAGARFSLVSERPDRMAIACRRLFDRTTLTGYLQDGLPEAFGHGAGEMMRQWVKLRGAPMAAEPPLTAGDLERCRMEWRSLLNHCLRLPPHLHPRLAALQEAIAGVLEQLPA